MNPDSIFLTNLDTPQIKEVKIQPIYKFIILDILSAGLYGVWWMYKSWKFFKERNKLDINPFLRVLFAIVFLHELFERILKFATYHGYKKTYNSLFLFILFFFFNAIARLPTPYWLLSFLGVFSLIPAVEALNFGISNSSDYSVLIEKNYNKNQILLIVISGVFWLLAILGLFIGEEPLQ